MRKAPLTIVLLLFIASLAYAVQETTWITYNSAEGRYNVALPAQPKLATQEAASADGQKLLQHMARVQERDVIYQVGYFDLLPGTVFSADSARDGMVNAVKGTLVSEGNITLDGYPGRELKISAKFETIDYVLRVKFWSTENRVYVVTVVHPKSGESEALTTNAAKYFDSFQILKDQPAKQE
jgi:hypothetical protein